jgi:hypothetical protein
MHESLIKILDYYNILGNYNERYQPPPGGLLAERTGAAASQGVQINNHS